MKSKFYIGLLSLFVAITCLNKVVAQVNPETERQIIALLQEKNSRSPTARKIDSYLLQALRESRGERMAPNTYLLPAKVGADAQGNLEVEIAAFVDDRIIKKIENLGGTITYAGFGYGSIHARINFNILEAIAALPEVKFITKAEIGVTNGPGLVGQAITKSQQIVYTPYLNKKAKPGFEERAANVRSQLTKYLQQHYSFLSFTGSNNSQGDRAHRTDDVRTTYGYQGQGIRIGIISDSYSALSGGAAADISSGNLPGAGNPNGNTTPVTVLQDFASGTDEGRAMLHIVHDIAPKAQLFFATANIGGQAGFAANILALRNAPNNCDIIVDDISYFAEAVFQDGTVARAVNTVTAGGCLCFSSAANSGSVLRGTAGVFEGDFNDAGSPAFTFPGGAKAGTVHNFGTLANPLNGDSITLASTSVYNLYWSDPDSLSSNDYDLFLVSTSGTVKGSSTSIQSGTQRPYEQLATATLVTGDKLIVFKANGAAVRAFALNSNRGKLAFFSNGQTHGHGSAVDAYSVAATPAAAPFGASAAGPFPNPFNSGNQVETFSSDGPRRMFYNENGTAITPGFVLFGNNGGAIRSKPDITAADGVVTNMAAGGLNPFYGTSAAAPHAGAIAALLKSANPTITPGQMRTLLTSTALDIESAGNDINSGVGIIQAFQAMQSLNPTALANINLGNVTATEAAPGNNGSGTIDPAENANLVIQLLNPSLANATSVSATLSTTTSGVSITQATASYGTINASSNSSNTALPFKFNVSGSVPCGTVINFSLAVTYTGSNSPQTFLFTVPVGKLPGGNINGTIGSAPPTSPDFTSASGSELGRLNRFSPASVCGTQKANPGMFDATTKAYHSFVFTNTNSTDQCVTVTMTTPANNQLFCVAYNSGGFIPATPSVNYLADFGSSLTPQTFGFTAPAGQSFTIVCGEVTTNSAAGIAYNLKVSLANCAATIPVKWLSFTAQPVNKQVQLQWKVANEMNLSHYEVEHATDGINYAKLYTVAASNSNSVEKIYHQLHTTPLTGNNYYRIKQIDKDGRSSYSVVQLVRIDKGNAISISPNPAKSVVNVQAGAMMKTIKLYSATGQLVMTVNSGTNSYQLDIAKLPAGQYAVKIETVKEVINQKIIKE